MGDMNNNLPMGEIVTISLSGIIVSGGYDNNYNILLPKKPIKIQWITPKYTRKTLK